MEIPSSSPTISQIAGALSVAQIWAIVLAVTTAFSAVGGFSYWLGHQTAEVSEREKLTALSAQLAMAKTETLIQSEHAQQSAEKLRQYVEYSSSLNSQIAQRDAQIASLNERQGRTNTCSYLQQQISALEQQMSNVTNGTKMRGFGLAVFGGNKDTQRTRDEQRIQLDDAELAQLQQRILTYSQQLSACAK